MWEKKQPKLKLVEGKKPYDCHETLNQINEFIRLGQGTKAKSLLHSINTKKIDNALDRTRYANLARRLSLPQDALKLLHTYVRPSERHLAEATDSECSEYAAALIKVGATTEALTLLKKLDTKSQPQVLLLIAFAYIATWEYEQAIEWLNKYIASPEITLYEKLVAKANLCEAMGFIKHPQCDKSINQTLDESEKNNFNLIVKHVLKNKAIRAIENKNWSIASESLVKAEKISAGSDTIESFFIKKWRAILSFYQDEKHSLNGLNAIRKEAVTKWNHYETVRDCDFYEAVITKNESLFSYLYYGTPFPSFRKRLLLYWKNHEDMPSSYGWNVHSVGKSTDTFELFSGDSEQRKKLVKASAHISILLNVLASDFYRPMRIAFLFSKLYPGDYFNPLNSPAKVRLVIHRVRKYLKAQKVPLVISENDGLYSLEAGKPITLVIPKNIVTTQIDSIGQKSDLLQSILADKPFFTATDVCAALKLNRRTANRLLTQALENGLIVRNGVGKNITYSWLKNQESPLKAA